MGWKIKAAVAKAFKIHSNKAFERRFQTPNLFSRAPFLCLHAYRCHATNGTSLCEGELVAIVRRENKIQIWLEAHIIGEVEEQDASELLPVIEEEPRAEQIIMARVEESIGVDGYFSVIPCEQVSGTESISK